MSTAYFNPFGTDYLIVRFHCPECGEYLTSDHIHVPEPNYQAEKARESYVDTEGYAYCEDCDEQYMISINSGYAGGHLYIPDHFDDEDIEIEEVLENYPEDEFEAILANTEFHDTFVDSLFNLRRLNDVDTGNEELNHTLKRQIWVSIIASIETYLSDALVNTVLLDSDLVKSFVQNYKGFKKQKFTLSEYYSIENKLEKVIKNELAQITYHNIELVCAIYQSVLEIDFPEFGEINRAISTRHIFVHRNGIDQNGEEIIKSHQEVQDLINSANEFITNIDQQIRDIQDNVG